MAVVDRLQIYEVIHPMAPQSWRLTLEEMENLEIQRALAYKS